MAELVKLSPSRDQALIAGFLAEAGLRMEADLEGYWGLLEGDALIAGGGYSGKVIKCLAVAEAHRGEDLLSGVITCLYTHMRQAGRENIFVFTKPEHLRLFTSLGFVVLARTDQALLLESRKGGITAQIQAWKSETPAITGRVGAVVMNANPFTLGHQYLLRQAAKAVELLHVFVVEEDKSAFPYEARLALVRAGAAELPNAAVHGGGPYLISSATFPSYFLKDPSGAATAYAALDATLFAEKLAPALSITRRFVGTEADDPLTALYNEAMLRILPANGIDLRVFPRTEAAGGPIRASRVRALFAEGKWEELSPLVPESTLAFLRSPAGQALKPRMGVRPC